MNKTLTFLVFTLLLQTAIYSSEIINIHSSFGKSPSKEININWRTADLKENPLVVYGTTTKFENTAKGTAIKSGDGFNYQVKLTNLKPNTLYHYRCGVNKVFSEDCTFKTSGTKHQTFTFAVVGDVQGKGTSKKWQETSAWLAKQNLSFWIPVGDLVDHGLYQKEWDCFFADSKELCQSSPIMPVIGNHDYYALDGKHGKPKLYLEQFSLPKNGKKEYQGLWYSFHYENAHFMILDTYPQTGDRKKDEEIVKVIQKQWLKNELIKSKSKWKFAFFHPPIYSSGPHGGDTLWLKDCWGVVFDQYHVDTVFTGHTHAFEVTHPIKNGKKVNSNTDGTIYYNTAGVNYSGVAKGNWFSEFRQETSRLPLIALVKVSDKEVLIETYNWQKNKLVHSVKLKK